MVFFVFLSVLLGVEVGRGEGGRGRGGVGGQGGEGGGGWVGERVGGLSSDYQKRATCFYFWIADSRSR
jgi:hypothetical protein